MYIICFCKIKINICLFCFSLVKPVPFVPGVVAAPTALATALQAGSGAALPTPLHAVFGAAQIIPLPAGGGTVPALPDPLPVGPCDIRNGRLVAAGGAVAVALPPPSIAGAAAVSSSSSLATCDIALQYQRLYEQQRDLSPLTHPNNHCATTAATAAAAASDAANSSVELRRPSGAIHLLDGRGMLPTYPPPPADYRLSAAGPHPPPPSSSVPVLTAVHAVNGSSDPNYQYLRNGETYLGPEYCTTTLPHKVYRHRRRI